MEPGDFDSETFFIANFNRLYGDVVFVVVVAVVVAGSQYVRASSMRDVRLLNNAENSEKKKMKVDGGGKEYGGCGRRSERRK